MANDTNSVILTGRLGGEPESRDVNGTTLTQIRVAVGKQWRDKQSGEQREETAWVEVDVWGQAANFCRDYLNKGSRVLIEGSIAQDVWEDKQTGQKRSKMKVKAFRIQSLDAAPAAQQTPRQQPQTQQAPPPPQQQAAPPPPPPFPSEPLTDDGPVEAGDEGIDDIPF
jgi:single-strand DNA-binding protein